MKLKIYLASSWKNAEFVMVLEKLLAQQGFEIYNFCNPDAGHFSFNIAEELTNAGCKLTDVDAISALTHPVIADSFKEAYKCDKEAIDWCNCLIMLMPCGRSAHLEAGYAKGQGKYLFIYWLNELVKGEFDNMYQFADGLYRMKELSLLIKKLKQIEAQDENGACKADSGLD